MTKFLKLIREAGNVPFSMEDPRFKIKPSQQASAACTGALLTSLFMTPLDVVKTRLQTQQRALLSNKCYLYCNGLMEHLCPLSPKNPEFGVKTQHEPQLKGTIDAFMKISRVEGIGVLWSGLGPTMISALPSTIIYFVAYEQFKQRLKYLWLKKHTGGKTTDSPASNSASMPFFVPATSGVLARSVAVTVVSPIELCRTKMQSQKISYTEMAQTIRTMVLAEGITTMWRGLRPTMFRDVPFSGIYWTCYETIKSFFEIVEPTFAFSFFAGATSGSLAAFLTTPFDVVKTHQQIEFGEKVLFTDNPVKNIPSKSTKERILELYRKHGLKGIFAGLGPRLTKVAPACAIMIASFEYGKSFWYKYNYNHYIIEIDGAANTSKSV